MSNDTPSPEGDSQGREFTTIARVCYVDEWGWGEYEEKGAGGNMSTGTTTPTGPFGSQWAEWIGRASAATLLGIALLGYFGGFWVSGSQYKEARAEAAAQLKATRDDYVARLTEVRGEALEWKKLALDGIQTAADAKRIRTSPPAPESTSLNDARERLESVQRFEP